LKIWLYSIDTRQLILFDPTVATTPDFVTVDEESSGIIDAGEILGHGWFLLDVQAHTLSTDTELVEGGQLLAPRG
jgi:hypothetical protein